MKLFVAGLPKDFDETDLREMFQLYGIITNVKLVEDRNTHKSKGFGFVTMPDKPEAMETIALFKNTNNKRQANHFEETDLNARFNSRSIFQH